MYITELEMLDAISTGLVRLRGQRDQLAAALHDAERQLSAIRDAARPQRGRRKFRTEANSLDSVQSSGGVVAAERKRSGLAKEHCGKRQALGRTLGQLRNRPRSEGPAGSPPSL
jgi:hypothetical protein